MRCQNGYLLEPSGRRRLGKEDVRDRSAQKIAGQHQRQVDPLGSAMKQRRPGKAGPLQDRVILPHEQVDIQKRQQPLVEQVMA